MVISAARLLSLFPIHSFGFGKQLFQVAVDDQRDSLIRSAAFIALGQLKGGNAKEEIIQFCQKKAERLALGSEIEFDVAAAVYALAACSEKNKDLSKRALAAVDACLSAGISEPTVAYYSSREFPDQIETTEDYYEAFLAPVSQFPWDLERQLQQQRKLLNKPVHSDSTSLKTDVTGSVTPHSAEASNAPKQLSKDSTEGTSTQQLPEPKREFTTEEVVRAVDELMSNFDAKPKPFRQALDRFAPFKPHGELAIQHLVQLLDHPDETKRKRAAWAIGQLKEHGRTAIDALIHRLPLEQHGRNIYHALEVLPINQSQFALLCDQVEERAPELSDGLFSCYERIIQANVSMERLDTWRCHSDERFQSWAFSALCAKLSPSEFKPMLLELLQDELDNPQEHSYGSPGQHFLQNAGAASWYFSDFQLLSKEIQKTIAEGFLLFRADVSEHRESFYRMLSICEDENLVSKLTNLIQYFKNKCLQDLIELARVFDRAKTTELKASIIEAVIRFRQMELDSQCVLTLKRLLQDDDEWVRKLTVEAIGFFEEPNETISQLLRDSLEDNSPEVQRVSMWCMSYRRDAEDLLDWATPVLTDRMITELIWACSRRPEKSTLIEKLSTWDLSQAPMSRGALEWLGCKEVD